MKFVSAAGSRGRSITAPETGASALTAPRLRAPCGRRGAAVTMRIVFGAAVAPDAESVPHAPMRSATASAVRQERNRQPPALDTLFSLRANPAVGSSDF